MRVCAVLVTLVGSLWTLPACAWTVAEVTRVTADVTVDAVDGAAEVRLQGDVAVRGGWLSRLELLSVSDESALVRPPRLFVLTEDDNAEVEPRAVRAVPLEHRFRKDGSLLLEIERKNAPKKGRYRFEVLYRVPGVVRGVEHGTELRWSLPPWQSGLDDVVVRVHLSERLGVRPADIQSIEELDAPVTEHDRPGYLTLTWMRPHLPRTLGWDVGAQVKGLEAPIFEPQSTEESDAVDVSTDRPRNRVDRAADTSFSWMAIAAGALLLLLAAVGRKDVRAAPAKHAPKAGPVAFVEMVGLRTVAIYYLRIGSRAGARVVPYLHLTFEPHSAAAVALRRSFSMVGVEDDALTLPYREGLVEELQDVLSRFAEAHRAVQSEHYRRAA